VVRAVVDSSRLPWFNPGLGSKNALLPIVVAITFSFFAAFINFR
jgi:hypothetical protein